jgi:hypothetical protein
MLKVRMIAFLVLVATSLVDHNDSAVAQAQPCRSKEYAHNAYTICEVDLKRHPSTQETTPGACSR